MIQSRVIALTTHHCGLVQLDRINQTCWYRGKRIKQTCWYRGKKGVRPVEGRNISNVYI